MTSEEIRKKFLSFFEKRGHRIVPSSSLVPENDPSVLLTTAGMQQFKRYFTGELNPLKDFGSARTASVQKSFRVSDIDEVGDETHLTFFEMLGNFSFGPPGKDDPADCGNRGYFKRSAIFWAYEFITEILGIQPERLSVSVFKGDTEVPKDEESFGIWNKEIRIPEEKIFERGRKDNFWGPTGNEGPCGPTTEIYIDGVENWNLVFNEYYCKKLGVKDGLEKLKNPGVDTGWGLERLMTAVAGANSVFETDLFSPLVAKISELAPGLPMPALRILSDHLRASAFLVADGIRPGNKETGYILRRLLRKILAYAAKYDIHPDLFPESVKIVADKFGGIYPEVKNAKRLAEVMETEKQKFQTVVGRGLAQLSSFIQSQKTLKGTDAFNLYETFGLPKEIMKELCEEKGLDFDESGFEAEFKKHQEISRRGAVKRFGGHGLVLDTGELKAGTTEEMKKVIRLHTATHLLHQALRSALGGEVRQMGSDITAERARLDFSFDRKLTDGEIRKIEDIVNQKIQDDLAVTCKELPKEEAEKTGALHFFNAKYPDVVKVYSIGDYSKEFCNGPHVSSTKKIGKLKITKEESVAAGVRRIRATVIP